MALVVGPFPHNMLTSNARADHQSDYDTDVNVLKPYLTEYASTVYAVTVGSEALYRYEHSADKSVGCTASDLANRISSFTKLLGDLGLHNNPIKVGTADSWNKFQDGTADAIIPIVDILYVSLVTNRGCNSLT